MDFEIDQARFLSALNLAQTVADRRSTMPILANVLLRVSSDHGLTCSATDMMISLTEKLDVHVTTEGSLTLGVRHLCNVLKTLPSGSVTMTALDNHWAKITAGRSEFKLMGMPNSEFPELPQVDNTALTMVPGPQLATLIQKTIFSVSTDEARVNLNGAFFECDGTTATMVSTDGHRLTKLSLPFEGPVLQEGIIIPRKGMIEIRKVLDRVDGEVGFAVVDQFLHLQSENLTLAVKLNSVTFPAYGQVIPKSHTRRATIDRHELSGALRQAEVMAPEKTATVRVELEEGTLRLTADNPELGVSNLEITAGYDGDKLVAGFNARYLIDALESIDTDQVHLDFQGELDPCVLRPVEGPDFLAVVMPMRI